MAITSQISDVVDAELFPEQRLALEDWRLDWFYGLSEQLRNKDLHGSVLRQMLLNANWRTYVVHSVTTTGVKPALDYGRLVGCWIAIRDLTNIKVNKAYGLDLFVSTRGLLQIPVFNRGNARKTTRMPQEWYFA